jgi:DNA-binding response OmpR family regulator
MSTASGGHQIRSRPLRSVVAVSGDPRRAELMDALLADANLRDIVFVESIARGYSRIKQVAPDVIVVLLGGDDALACQLLSMLHIDPDTAGIPVVMWMTRPEETEIEDLLAQVSQDWSSPSVAIRMH